MPQTGNGIPMGLKNTETARTATAELMNTRVEELTHQSINAPLIRVEPMSSSGVAEVW